MSGMPTIMPNVACRARLLQLLDGDRHDSCQHVASRSGSVGAGATKSRSRRRDVFEARAYRLDVGRDPARSMADRRRVTGSVPGRQRVQLRAELGDAEHGRVVLDGAAGAIVSSVSISTTVAGISRIRSFGAPSATSLPRSRMASPWQRRPRHGAWTRGWSCPRDQRKQALQKSRRLCGSTALVGSSSSSSSGLCSVAAASAAVASDLRSTYRPAASRRSRSNSCLSSNDALPARASTAEDARHDVEFSVTVDPPRRTSASCSRASCACARRRAASGGQALRRCRRSARAAHIMRIVVICPSRWAEP